jgi:hypothetical protein
MSTLRRAVPAAPAIVPAPAAGGAPAGAVPWRGHPFLAATLAALAWGGVRFAWLRGPQGGTAAGRPACREVDLIVEGARLPRLSAVLARRGFVKLPGWGVAPHHFFVGYDARRGEWWKLDVVTDLRYGHPVRALRGGDVTGVLDRVDDDAHLAPDDELLTLLLRCLLNRGEIPPSARQRLAALHREVARRPELAARAARETDRWLAPALPWEALSAALEREDWRGLLSRRRDVARRLLLRQPLAAAWRRIATPAARKLRPLLFLLRGRDPAVLLLGRDEAARTALARALAAQPFLRAFRAPPAPGPARDGYRGLPGGLVVHDRHPDAPPASPRPAHVFLLDAPPAAGPVAAGVLAVDAADPDGALRTVVGALWNARVRGGRRDA